MSGLTNAGQLAGKYAARKHGWDGPYPPTIAGCGGQVFCRPHGDPEEYQQGHQAVLAPRVEQQPLTGRPVRAGQHITAEDGGQEAHRADGNRRLRRHEQLALNPWRELRALATGLLAAVYDSLARISRRYRRWRHQEAADDEAAAVAATDRPSEITRRRFGQTAPSAEDTAREYSDNYGAGRLA